jgi:hypothetical protein
VKSVDIGRGGVKLGTIDTEMAMLFISHSQHFTGAPSGLYFQLLTEWILSQGEELES